jgi:hypothetical protein
MGKNLPVPGVQEIHCGGSNMWPGIIVQQQYSKVKKHLQGLRIQIDEDDQEEVRRWLRLQHASFYHQGFDCLICHSDKCLNSYGDNVEKQTAYVPIPSPCIT